MKNFKNLVIMLLVLIVTFCSSVGTTAFAAEKDTEPVCDNFATYTAGDKYINVKWQKGTGKGSDAVPLYVVDNVTGDFVPVTIDGDLIKIDASLLTGYTETKYVTAIFFSSLNACSLTIEIVKESEKVETPKTPSKVKASLNSTKGAVITWNKVEGATGYRLYRKTSTDKKWVAFKTTSKTKFTDTKYTAKAGSKVKYAVKAYVKVDGKTVWSKLSKTVSVKTPAKTTK